MIQVKEIKPIVVEINITLGIRRKKGSMTSLISLPKKRSLLKTQRTIARKIKHKTPHQ
jgi:hypothetical protein